MVTAQELSSKGVAGPLHCQPQHQAGHQCSQSPSRTALLHLRGSGPGCPLQRRLPGVGGSPKPSPHVYFQAPVLSIPPTHHTPPAPSSQPRASLYLEHLPCGHLMSAKAAIQSISAYTTGTYFSQVWKFELSSRCSRVGFGDTSLLPRLHTATVFCVPTWSFLRAHGKRERREKETPDLGD